MAGEEVVIALALIAQARDEWEGLSRFQRMAYERWARFYGYERGFLYFVHRHFGVWIEPEGSAVFLIPWEGERF